MKYTNEDFIRLMSAVDADGGEHLDETCAMDEITYTLPEGRHIVEHTHGCENETLFAIPYDPDSTVLVPEPILEDDPERDTYTAPDGTEQHVTRAKKIHNEATGRDEVLFEIVERGPDADNGGLATLGVVKACAVGDNVGMWPRFQHAMRDKGTG